MIEQTISHFKITAKLGQGGMGVVYRGVDLNLDRPVAIKFLPADKQDSQSSARFLREAKLASRLQHPAVTTIYEFGVKDETLYLVMEYIDGETLRQVLGKGPISAALALDIAIQIAEALTVAAENAIIHRDLKPENIMIGTRGQVKILDFGLAKAVGMIASDTFQTATGLVMGTVSYMSPEQALGAPLDPRTDIYSLGIVLFEMLAGQVPFVGESPSVILAKILNQAPPTLSEMLPSAPPALEQVVARCIEKKRENRYETAKHLLADLRAVRKQVSDVPFAAAAAASAAGAATVAARPLHEDLAKLVPDVRSSQPTVPLEAAVPAASASGDAPPVNELSSGALPVLSEKERVSRTRAIFALRQFNRVIRWLFYAYSLGCLFLFAAPLLRAQRVAAFPLTRLLNDITGPVLSFFYGLFSVSFVFQGYNLLLLGLAVISFIVGQIISSRLNALEIWLYKPIRQADDVARQASRHARTLAAAAPGARDASRGSLLREYVVARRILGEARREFSFLSVDVIGSTKMKVGEDKLVIEHAFNEYKKFLERIFRETRIHKVAWTPDGVMCCFASVDDAATAGRRILSELDWFNKDVHHLRGKFRVRCGLNGGEVIIPDDKPLEEVSDHVIDVAGHLQKYASENTLWVSRETYDRLADKTGFESISNIVDEHRVYEFRKQAE